MNRQSNMPPVIAGINLTMQSSNSSNNHPRNPRSWSGGPTSNIGHRGGGNDINPLGANIGENQQRNRQRNNLRGRRSKNHTKTIQPSTVNDRSHERNTSNQGDVLDHVSGDVHPNSGSNAVSLETSTLPQQTPTAGETMDHLGNPSTNRVSTDVDATSSHESTGTHALNQSNNKTNKSNSRAIGGKYKQRRGTRHLIDGLDGLNLDLIESLAPSDAVGCGRTRHTTNTRKINLSQLVNNSYDRRQPGGMRARHDSTSSGNTHRHHQFRYHSSSERRFSKQQFLQANCQFVVLDGYDYTVHKVDPDWPVDWNCIEEVKFRQIGATETNCPICLEPPAAAKITKCGHIYCWACMLRYLSMSDENSVACPICFEPIYVNDLRSVVAQSYPDHIVGEDISMRLMLRVKGCVQVEPYHPFDAHRAFHQHANSELTDQKDPHYSSQANLIIVDPITVVNQVARREKSELQARMDVELADLVEGANESAQDGYSGMICFFEQALEKVDRRIDKLIQLASDETRMLRIQHQNLERSDTNLNLEFSSRSYLFYQSSDGQHIYLNPFSTKVLCHEYSALENCPTEVRARILQMDWISMNEGWRKRFKYLEHLPLSCEFRLIEIDFEESNIVSQETFKLFEDQIRSRSKERMRRLREEARRDKLIQVEQNKKIYGIQPSLEISLDNPEQFPSVLNERYLGIDSHRSHENEADAVDDKSSDEAQDDPSTSEAATQMTISFAEIQLQEAAKAEKLAKRQRHQKQAGPNVWSGGSSNRIGQGNQNQSSFAQLLVDAKTSQQKWTKSTSSHSGSLASGAGNSQNQQTLPGHQGPQPTRKADHQAAEDSDGGEELKAPPYQFSISDYLSQKVIVGKKRGKKK